MNICPVICFLAVAHSTDVNVYIDVYNLKKRKNKKNKIKLTHKLEQTRRRRRMMLMMLNEVIELK